MELSGRLFKKEVVFLLELVGTYEHNIDGKNRLFVPAKFRAVLGNEFIYRVRRSKYPSIQLYSKKQFFKETEDAIAGINDEIEKKLILNKRYLGTGEADCDAQGRIVISAYLAKMAKLEKECVLTGFGDFVEIMSADVYVEYNDALLEAAQREEEAYYMQEELRNKRRAEGAYLDIANKTEE